MPPFCVVGGGVTLRDINTVKMVAAHWLCSADTVYRRVADGSLRCLRLAGVLRITRAQVEQYEAQCGGAGPASPSSPCTARGSNSAFQRGSEIAGRAARARLDQG